MIFARLAKALGSLFMPDYEAATKRMEQNFQEIMQRAKRSHFLSRTQSCRKVFLTRCQKETSEGLQDWCGPEIYANTWEEAESQCLQMRIWLQQTESPFTGLHVIGILESVIPVEDV